MTTRQHTGEAKMVTYDAFLSYRHVALDSAVTQALHSLLEAFRVPKGMEAQKHAGFRVFMDGVELIGSPELGRMIEEAATSAGCLFVICSRATQERPKWIHQEIDDFLSVQGRDFARIFPILVEGTPEEAFSAALLARHREVPLDYLDITAPTQAGVLENLRANRRWAQSRMAGVQEDALDTHLRRARIRRWVLGTVAAAVLLTGVILGAGYFMRQAQEGRDESAGLLMQTEESRAREQENLEQAQADARAAKNSADLAGVARLRADESRKAAEKSEAEAVQSEAEAVLSEKEAEASATSAAISADKAEENRALAAASQAQADESRRIANTARAQAEQDLAAAEKDQAASAASEAEANRSREEAEQSRQDYENEQENVVKAEADYSENEIWARIVLYEMELENLRPLQARSYAKALLEEDGLNAEQRKAAKAIVDKTYPDTRLTPVYREVGPYYAGYSPDGRTLITGASDGSINSYDAESLALLGEVKLGGSGTRTPVFTSDSEYVAITAWDDLYAVSIYETRTLQRVKSQGIVYDRQDNYWSGGVRNALFLPGTHDLYYCHAYLGMYRTDLEETVQLDYPVIEEFASAIPINEEIFVVTRYYSNVPPPYDPPIVSYVYNARTDTLGEPFLLGYHEVCDIFESADGRYLGLAGWNDTNGERAYVFDRNTGKLLWEHQTAQFNNQFFGFAGDGTLMLGGSHQEGAKIYTLDGRFEQVAQYNDFSGIPHVNVAQVCMEGKALLYACETTLLLGDIETNQMLERTETAHTSRIERIIVSPTGYQAVTISQTEAIVWELR